MAGTLASLYHRLSFPIADLLRRNSNVVRSPFYLVARLHRRRHASVPLVLVTGSSGKTTTRSLIARVLGRRHGVVETRGNDNIDFHMHRYVLRSRRGRNQVLVLEAGIQSARNAYNWSRVLDPDVFVLTNVGEAHLAWLGSRAGVLEAKLALGKGLRPRGTVVLNADDDALRGVRRRWPRVVTFGESADADVRAASIHADRGGLRLEIVTPRGPLSLRSPLLGRHQAASVLAAVACGHVFDVAPDDVAEAIAGSPALPHRLQPLRRGELAILDDSYSANPASVRAALDTLDLFPGRRVVVLGDMLDQGEATTRLHRALGREIARRRGELALFLYGPATRWIAEELAAHAPLRHRVEHAPTKLHLLAALEGFLRPGDVVLVKGSRGMQMDEVVDALGRPAWTPALDPMPDPREVGAFGVFREPERCHAGVDLPVPVGTPVRAIAAGVVVSGRVERLYGRVVRIRHPGRLESVYGHLSRTKVRGGQPVVPGTVIGLSGRSGIFHTGNDYDYPHLHFELRHDGVPLDPTPWLRRPAAGPGQTEAVVPSGSDAPSRPAEPHTVEPDAADPAAGPEAQRVEDGSPRRILR